MAGRRIVRLERGPNGLMRAARKKIQLKPPAKLHRARNPRALKATGRKAVRKGSVLKPGKVSARKYPLRPKKVVRLKPAPEKKTRAKGRKSGDTVRTADAQELKKKADREYAIVKSVIGGSSAGRYHDLRVRRKITDINISPGAKVLVVPDYFKVSFQERRRMEAKGLPIILTQTQYNRRLPINSVEYQEMERALIGDRKRQKKLIQFRVMVATGEIKEIGSGLLGVKAFSFPRGFLTKKQKRSLSLWGNVLAVDRAEADKIMKIRKRKEYWPFPRKKWPEELQTAYEKKFNAPEVNFKTAISYLGAKKGLEYQAIEKQKGIFLAELEVGRRIVVPNRFLSKKQRIALSRATGVPHITESEAIKLAA